MKKPTEEQIQIIIIVFLVLLILPFLILCFFNHPCPEDMSWTENTHRSGFIKSQIHIYKTENVRFLTCALLSINPLIFHSVTGYKILIFFMMILIFYSVYLLTDEVLPHELSARIKLLISLSIIFLYLYGMPTAAFGFYYLSGVMMYNLSLILLILFIVFYLRMERASSKNAKIRYSALSAVIFFAIIGTCELAVVLLAAMVFLLLLNKIISGQKPKAIFIIYVVLLLLFCCMVFGTPGNVNRFGDQVFHNSIIDSVYNSFMFTAGSVRYWFFKTPLAGVTLLLMPVFLYISKSKYSNLIIFNINPLTALMISFAMLISPAFFIYFSINTYPYNRIHNFIYFVFLIFWFYNVLLLTFFISKKMDFDFKHLSKIFYAAGFIIIIFFLIKKTNNIRTAYSELVRGKAAEYNSQMNNRYKTIYECKSDRCLVDSISVIPKTLGEVQLTSDPMNNFNRWYSRFFHKKYIYLR